jgi:hypothetical protein
MAERHPIFDLEDLAILLSRGLVGETHDGMRKLHRRMTYRSADEEYRRMPLDVTPTDGGEVNGTSIFVDVPKFYISKATMLHVGYTENKSSGSAGATGLPTARAARPTRTTAVSR